MFKRYLGKFPKKLELLATTLLLFLAIEQTAFGFGLGDITGPIEDTVKGVGRSMDPTVAGSKTSPIHKYQVVISNATNNPINYRLNDSFGYVRGGYTETWTVKNTSRTALVSFDNGQNQTINYDVGAGHYVFKWNNGVLNLFNE